MAAGAEPLVVWINGAFGVGTTAAAWAERAPRKLLDAYRAERGEVEHGEARHGEARHGEARHGEAEFPEPERGEEA